MKRTIIVILSSWALATLAGALVMSHPRPRPVRVVSRPQQAAFDRLDLPDHVDRITPAAPGPRVPSPVAARSVPAVTAPPSTAARPRSPAQVAVGTPQSAGGVLGCIMRHESGGRNVWNTGGSGASGYFQWLGSSWRAVSGLPGNAIDYPYSVQAAVTARVIAHGGIGNWAGSGC